MGLAYHRFKHNWLLFRNFFIVLCTLGSTLFCRVYNKAKHPRSFFSSRYQLEKLALQVFKTFLGFFSQLRHIWLLRSSQSDVKTITTPLIQCKFFSKHFLQGLIGGTYYVKSASLHWSQKSFKWIHGQHSLSHKPIYVIWKGKFHIICIFLTWIAYLKNFY